MNMYIITCYVLVHVHVYDHVHVHLQNLTCTVHDQLIMYEYVLIPVRTCSYMFVYICMYMFTYMVMFMKAFMYTQCTVMYMLVHAHDNVLINDHGHKQVYIFNASSCTCM